MKRMASWDGYADFLSIARAGSISAAAREIGVAQPTLSRRLAALEGELGVRLLSRTPVGLTLTPAGERMFAALDRVRETIQQVEAEVAAGDVALRGSVRITVTETLGVEWLAPLMAEFNEAYPQIRVELVVENSMLNLLGREAHVAIRLLRPAQGDLIAKRVGAVDIALFAARGYARRYGLPKTAEEARTHRAVGLLGITPTAVLTEETFTAERHVFLSNSMLAVRRAVAAGIGIGPLLDFPGADDDLVPCLDHLRLNKEIWLTAVPELRENARLRAVYDFLADRLAADAAVA
jgi:DNA-binding transcriptional LysR family regulator